MLLTNCYLLWDDKSLIVIDPGKMTAALKSELELHKGKETLILLTHAHFDHVLGLNEVKSITGGKVALQKDEVPLLGGPGFALSARVRAELETIVPDILFEGDCDYDFGNHRIRVILSPGHTAAGACYLIDGKLFSGDTLFFRAVGRTDFPTGDENVLLSSLEKLFSLFEDCEVFPGHGEKTTIAEERKYRKRFFG